MNRGDVVVGVTPGDFGKPRPALIVQSDLFNATHGTIVICLITSHETEASFFRIPIAPCPENGLRTNSQVMIDKIVAVKRQKLHKTIGRLSHEQMAQIDRALGLWLNLDAPFSR